MVKQVVSRKSASDPEHLIHRQWQYDAAGRLTAAMDSVWGDKHYRHNVLNQLISVRSRNHEEIYGYRASGALIEAREGDQGSGRLVLNEGSVLRATENFEYEVDACNRRTVKRDKRTGKTVQYVWDCRNRLREVRFPDRSSVRYFYDAFGRRVRKDRYSRGGEPRSLPQVWGCDR